MFILVLLIILIAIVFSILLEYEDNTLYIRNCISSSVIFTFIFNCLIFFLIYYYQHEFILLICGLLIILKGFSYLGILNFKFISKINPFISYSFLASVVISSSILPFESALFIFIGFYFLFFIIAPILNSLKSSEFLTILLELNRVISGIFMFIIGLVIAANRIPFLEKIALKIF